MALNRNRKRFFRDYYSFRRFAVQQALVGFGAAFTAFGYTLFQVPFDITAGGLSGLAIIINHFTGWREGMLFFIMNIPLVVLGYFYLGRWRFIASTTFCLVIFSFCTDFFIVCLPQWMNDYPVTDNVLLASLYAGISFGIGNGIIFRAGGSFPAQVQRFTYFRHRTSSSCKLSMPACVQAHVSRRTHPCSVASRFT